MQSIILRRAPRIRRGRLLIEAIVALAMVTGALLLIAGVAGRALAMGDAATEFDRAAQSAFIGGADALRAPCGALALPPVAQWSARHRTTRLTVAGEVARLRVTDQWEAVGVGRHDARLASAEIGVRCD